MKKILIAICVISLFIPALSQASPTISDCTGRANDGVSDTTDILAVMWNINDDWADFESYVEWHSDTNVGDALHSDFSNGYVECQYSPGFLEACSSGGEAYSLNILGAAYGVAICDEFIDHIDNRQQKNRRACYAAVLTEEFSRGNFHYSTANELGEAAFDYWADRFGATIDYEDCGL